MDGRLLAGRYRLTSVVGRGGMGTVWRARDETLDREVAIKEVLLPDGLSDAERENRHRRTLREARASARLNHPGVVTVHDVVDEDDRPWIVMELVRARSLQEIVEEDGPLPPGRVATIGRQIAGALRAAHAIGILHRDVKPANVLVADGDRAVLTDFGIAQMAGDATLTGTGLLIGSPAYMSPERVNGEPAIPASDLWALGATLYAATEGRAPHHRGDPMAVLAAVMTQDVPPPKNAGPLAPVLTGLLERDPVRRLSGDRAEEALQAVASGHAVHMANVQIASNEATAVDGPAGSDVPPAPAPAPVPVPVPPDMTTQYPPGTGQQWTPTHAPASSRKRSSVVPVLAGAAVAAVILGVAGFVFWPEGSSSAGGPGTGTGTAQSPPVQQTSPTTPATTPPATPTSTPGGTVAPLPPGFVRGTGPGYTIGVPRGWRRSVQGNSVVWTDPASSAYVQVDQTVWSGDPYEHWVTWEQEARADGKLKDFQRIGEITRTTVAGRPAADIEFTWTRGTGATRARDRGVIAGGRPYAVVVAVPASQWNGNEALVKNVLDTFRPSGVG
ncbi:serine/threonine protein kinase [Actinomadura madurae]|uniref:serine/threonine-protein kinase n=1 Tax=Actinomadura madurae TaxID=1993 RepID=UPI002026EC7F|nr:serine/threonine-protein kinase [Actinomadura madurae]MCP9950406.1 serine/threonine protein kinase [Actinomadura madurae]URM95956.1 serine/threonine protein kinase [Actinomadura madurae]URN06654.1 serine/threonine protein kinase [Actinomadura madurae]